jgi:probable F420-dependent oxidoreductase
MTVADAPKDLRVGAFLAPWGPLATPEHVTAMAHEVERSGIESLWVGDHVIFPRGTDSTYRYNDDGRSPFDPDEPHFESFALIAFLAGRTTRVHLGISVLVLAMRNPVLAAKMLGNLQTLSEGRLRVGIGVGWLREEFEALGADFTRRGAVTDEYLRLLRHLWTADPRPFRGDHYRLPPVGFAPPPRPPIPVVIGGNSDPALRRTVRLGDGWHPLRLGPDELRRRRDVLRRLADEAGRDPGELTIVHRDRLLDLDQIRSGPPTGDALADRLAARLDEYRSAGVDEFVLEFPFPGSPPARQLEWLAWFGEQALRPDRVPTPPVT